MNRAQESQRAIQSVKSLISRLTYAFQHKLNCQELPLIGVIILCLGIAGCGSGSALQNQSGKPTPTKGNSDSSKQTFAGNDSEDELPPGWIQLRFNGTQYVCEKVGYSDADCVQTYGVIPTYIGDPDLYCSNANSSFPDCSSLWYPDELSDFRFIQDRSYQYVCEDSYSGFSYGDAECFRYSGGDPSDALRGLPDLYCSDSFSTVPTCDEEYFPSEIDGLEFATIDGDDYVCEDSFGGLECYEWFGFGSPRDAIGYWPDYYCNDWGECSPDDFP